jgi:flagellar motor switch protein FliN/FliY
MNDDDIKSLRSLPSNMSPSVQKIALPEFQTPGASVTSQAGFNESSKLSGAVAGMAVVSDLSPLYQVKASLQVCVGEATITVGELLSAKEHQVLKLDRTLDHPVDLLLNGQVVARGQLVAVDGHFAVRIIELPAPLNLGLQT